MLALLSCPVGAQTVTFTGQEDEGGQLRLNHVVVSNRTQGWQGIVFGPDTLLTLQNMTEVDYLGNDDGISLSPNNPNPFMATTEVCLTIAEDGEVTLLAADMSGQMEAVHTTCLEAGTHKFQVSLATKGLHVLAAHKGAAKTSIVMMCNGGGSANAIDYLRILSQETPEQHDLLNAGDMMEYVGYTGIGGGFLKETEPYGAFDEGGEYGEFGEDNGYDSFYYMFKFSAGLLMEIGDLHKSPFVLGVSPCTGLGFLDMDLFLPVELRLGHVFNRHWYIMTDIVYGVSLAEETMFIEPSIRVGYNFGHKPRTRKK